MSSPNDKLTRNGQTLTRRVWELIADVGHENGVALVLVQGGFKAGHGASASAGTHNKGDVYDISIRGLTRTKQLAVVRDLREWYGDAWLRTPEFGWPSSAGGPHIHVVQADSYYALSSGAKQQVAAYNNGRNGLRSNLRDPFFRPVTRRHFTGSAHSHVIVPPPAHAAVRLANLRYGLTNDDVKDLQRALNAHLSGPDIPVDGRYGSTTDAMVRRDQAAHVQPADAAGHSSVGARQAAHLGLRVV
jgi:hypothetical protein